MSHSKVLKGLLMGVVVLVLLIPMQLTAAEGSTDVNEFIVKAPDSEALQAFVDSSGLEIGPLITYPNPSEEVLRYTRYSWIVSVPDSLQSVKDSLVEVLKAQPWVEYVEPNAIIQIEPEVEGESEGYLNMPDSFPWPYTPNDPLYPQQWNMRITKTNWAWNVSTGDGVKVGIIDTGIDTDHEDLEPDINFDLSYDFVNNNINIEDGNGHGTHVSGIAAAKIDNNKGITGIAGNADICVLQVYKSGGMSLNAGINAIYYATDNNIKIINMSFGSYTPSQERLIAINYAWENGVFLCGGAGNDSKNDCVYPAKREHVMGVGATTSSDSRWSKSNYGSAVDIYAPGSNVLTTEEDGSYATHSGTSDATPHIAGLAALIWEANPDYTNQDVWDAIINGADTITIDKGKVLRMNSMRALGIDSVGIAEPVTPVTPVTPITHLSNWQVTASIGSQITLRYADHPEGFSASIFDPSGRQVDEVHSAQTSGTVSWGEGYGPGVYFIREAQGSTTHKVVLVR